MKMSDTDIKEVVKEKYGQAALRVSGGGSSCCGATAGNGCSDPITSNLYDASLFGSSLFGSPAFGSSQAQQIPEEALLASLGCGNPTALAKLNPGETVLDLGSGGGIDVLLSAKRVGATGKAYGLDMTDEMLALANENKHKAGMENVEFLKGEIEHIPLPDDSVDVIISNCVINLSADKPAVLAEMFRVLVPGGRIGIADVVAEDHMSPADRAAAGSYVGCIAGALTRAEYLAGLSAAGFADVSVTFTTQAAPGLHSAVIRAVRPAASATCSAT
jgi:SAM-dependent methyltransferase